MLALEVSQVAPKISYSGNTLSYRTINFLVLILTEYLLIMLGSGVLNFKNSRDGIAANVSSLKSFIRCNNMNYGKNLNLQSHLS